MIQGNSSDHFVVTQAAILECINAPMTTQTMDAFCGTETAQCPSESNLYAQLQIQVVKSLAKVAKPVGQC